MSSQQDYVLHLLALKRAETMLSLQGRGYDVTADVRFDDQAADLVAKKGDHTIIYEFKVVGDLRQDSEQIQRLRSMASRKGFEFKLVIVKPPKRPSIEVEGLESILFDLIANQIQPDDLYGLASAVYIEGVSDMDVSTIEVRKEEIEISGDATVEVRLEYGGGEARDGVTSDDSYPFSFRVVLNPNLDVVRTDELEVDTSSFYE